MPVTLHVSCLFMGVTILPLLVSASATQESISLAAESNRLFTVELLQELIKDGRNVFFSPFSISSAMALASLGANGNTLDEINKVLHFDLINEADSLAVHDVYQHLIQTLISSSFGYNVSMASAFFGKPDIDVNPEFRTKAKMYYHSDFQTFHGNADAQINEWASRQTNHMIPNLLPPGSITADLMMVLINAVYFKGNWAIPFDRKKTKLRDFYVGSKEKVQVPTMFMLEEFPYGFNPATRSTVLELPYSQEILSMYAVLPPKKDGLKHLVQQLTSEILRDFVQTVILKKIEVKFPKFKLNLQLPLSKLLNKFGINDLFTNPDLSGLALNAPPVTDIRHGAAIDVNEEGTEAAAATAVLMERAMPPEFNANRPFLFFIVHKPTDFILFAGAIFRP